MVFLGAFLAQARRTRTHHRRIPRRNRPQPTHSSHLALMNRIEFVGNAIFIPLLPDRSRNAHRLPRLLPRLGKPRSRRRDDRPDHRREVHRRLAHPKIVPALSPDQRTVISASSSAHVAATLAAVMVGYNVILGHTPDGEPIRLLNESVLNGTILMILATCTVSTFATQRGAHNIAVCRQTHAPPAKTPKREDHILIPVAHEGPADELVGLSSPLSSPPVNPTDSTPCTPSTTRPTTPMSKNRPRRSSRPQPKPPLPPTSHLQEPAPLRREHPNAIVSVARERSITDIVMGMHLTAPVVPALPGIPGTPARPAPQSERWPWTSSCRATSQPFLYWPVQPINTIKRHLIVVPEKSRTGGRIPAVAAEDSTRRKFGAKIAPSWLPSPPEYLRPKGRKRPANIDYVPFSQWDDIPSLEHDLRDDDCLWFVMSRRDRVSTTPPWAGSLAPGAPLSPDTAPFCSIPYRPVTPKADTFGPAYIVFEGGHRRASAEIGWDRRVVPNGSGGCETTGRKRRNRVIFTKNFYPHGFALSLHSKCIKERTRYEPRSNRRTPQRRQIDPLQPPRRRTKGDRRRHGRHDPRPSLRQNRLERPGVLRDRHGRIYGQFGRYFRGGDPPPGDAGHRRGGRHPLSGGGSNRHHRPRPDDGRHPAPHDEEGDPCLQQGRQQRPDLLIRTNSTPSDWEPLLHQLHVGKRHGRPDGRHPRGAARGCRGRDRGRSAAHHDRRTSQCRQVVAHERPARHRAQHRNLDRRNHARLDPYALQQVRHGLLPRRYGRHAQEGQDDGGSGVLLPSCARYGPSSSRTSAS